MLKDDEIISIEECGEEECYDIEVPDYGNFFLANMLLSSNSRYVFIPWNIDYTVAKDAMKGAGIEEVQVKSTQYNAIRQMMAQMKTRDWIAIDKNTKSFQFITPLSPLTGVKETE